MLSSENCAQISTYQHARHLHGGGGLKSGGVVSYGLVDNLVASSLMVTTPELLGYWFPLYSHTGCGDGYHFEVQYTAAGSCTRLKKL